MEQNDTEVINSTNDTEATVNTEVENTQESEDTITIPKKKWDEIQAQKDHWKEKATKVTESKPEVKPVKQETGTTGGITVKDVLTLTSAGITHDEDVETVEKWARFNSISIKEALQDKTLKSVLADKQEERRTASATQTKGGPRSSTKSTAEALLNDASKGKLPENDTDIDALAEARWAQRKNRK